MISIITPTHRPTYLLEVYKSLVIQTVQNWEWILITNNGGTVPEEITKDPRCKVTNYEGPHSDKIGFLKNFACSLTTNPYILELDHDDTLLPTALEDVINAFENNPNVVFVYSNTVEYVQETMQPYTYSAAHGWRYRDFEWNGHKLKEAIAFAPTPHALAYIYYAPNHLRAWRKDTYNFIAGHDQGMRVIDDQDLMCRLYLQGDFYHIDKPLYMYRVHGINSWLERNEEVQIETKNTYAKYIYEMVSVWCDRNNYLKLDFGSERGQAPVGWKTVDIRPGCDYEADLSKVFPFEDNSIGAIRAWDFMEHIPNKILLMNEIHRVLKPGGWLLSGTPSTDGRGAFQDPTHVSFWNQNSHWYHTKAALQRFVPEITARFQVFRNETMFPTDFHKENNISYVRTDLVALKKGYDRPDTHFPGVIEI